MDFSQGTLSQEEFSQIDPRVLVMELKQKFFKKWTDLPQKKKNISRHLPFTEYSLTLTLPINSQKVKIIYLNIFADNLQYEHVQVPNNSFKNKQELMHIILKKNSHLLETLVGDETNFGTEEQPRALTWFGGISTVNIIQNRLGDIGNLVKDVDMISKCEVTQQDIMNNLQRFPLEQVFEIHRLDLFQGNLFHNSIHPLEEQ